MPRPMTTAEAVALLETEIKRKSDELLTIEETLRQKKVEWAELVKSADDLRGE